MKHVLNQYFDRIYCLTVHTFVERHKQTREQLEGIEFEWILSPTSQSVALYDKLSPSEVSNTLGQLSVICNAKLNGFKRIAIWEDDGILTATEDEIKLFLDNVPGGWDCLYMGNASWTDKIWPAKIEPYSEHVSKVLWGNGCAFTGVNSHVYDELITRLLVFRAATDFKFNRVFARGNSYGPKKFFSVPNSMPHEGVRHKFSAEELSQFIPSYISHSK